jgi:hypothetical protein
MRIIQLATIKASTIGGNNFQIKATGGSHFLKDK